ncbi:MAG: hypothetical protein L7S53_07025, partial [Luminiphilus sp.]|nr:hypothetical protein [Luminiphilus sp.]
MRIPVRFTLSALAAFPFAFALGVEPIPSDMDDTNASEPPEHAAEIVTDEAVLISEVVPPDERFIDRAKLAFEESELVFVRSLNNAPFLPVAFLGNTHYGDAMVSEEGGTPDTAGKRYRLNSTSQY